MIQKSLYVLGADMPQIAWIGLPVESSMHGTLRNLVCQLTRNRNGECISYDIRRHASWDVRHGSTVNHLHHPVRGGAKCES